MGKRMNGMRVVARKRAVSRERCRRRCRRKNPAITSQSGAGEQSRFFILCFVRVLGTDRHTPSAFAAPIRDDLRKDSIFFRFRANANIREKVSFVKHKKLKQKSYCPFTVRLLYSYTNLNVVTFLSFRIQPGTFCTTYVSNFKYLLLIFFLENDCVKYINIFIFIYFILLYYIIIYFYFLYFYIFLLRSTVT